MCLSTSLSIVDPTDTVRSIWCWRNPCMWSLTWLFQVCDRTHDTWHGSHCLVWELTYLENVLSRLHRKSLMQAMKGGSKCLKCWCVRWFSPLPLKWLEPLLRLLDRTKLCQAQIFYRSTFTDAAMMLRIGVWFTNVRRSSCQDLWPRSYL